MTVTYVTPDQQKFKMIGPMGVAARCASASASSSRSKKASGAPELIRAVSQGDSDLSDQFALACGVRAAPNVILSVALRTCIL